MITVGRRIAAPPEAVFAVLADGWLYPVWVVGASRIRQVDPAWPAAGARLHHSFGLWPVMLDDVTRVLACEPARRLLLRAHGWPLGEATVEITLEPDGDGTRVAVAEDATKGPGRLVPGPVRQAAIAPRNREALRRLAFLVEQGAVDR